VNILRFASARTMCAAIAAAVMLGSAAPSSAAGLYVDVTFTNASDHDNWVDFATSYPGLPWVIRSTVCVKKGETVKRVVAHNEHNEFRARAEIKDGGCGARTLRTLEMTQKSTFFAQRHSSTLKLETEGERGAYNLRQG